MEVGDLKEQVRQHWEREPCGSRTGRSEPGTLEFFRDIERWRYRAEPFIPGFADFERWRSADVLEVGMGLGTDLVQFVRAGARVTGIDLTNAAVAATEWRLLLEGLEATVLVADAERLPFADASFDLVYSWGVLHHSPDPKAALAEIRRVLRPGGELRLMLYSRRSWFAFGAWARWGLARGRPWRTIVSILAEHLESPGTKAYTRAELRELLAPFRTWKVQGFVTRYDRMVGGPLARLTGERLGFFLGVVANT